jgi:voltage-gated sodium channel
MIKDVCVKLTDLKKSPIAKYFELSVMIIIIANAVILGIQSSYNDEFLYMLDEVFLLLFAVEFAIRYIAVGSFKNFLKKPILLFDFFVISVCFLPDSLFADSEIIGVLRVIRVLRVLRLITMNPELNLIVKVLLKSIGSLSNTMALVAIFVYVFSVMGVQMFSLPEEEGATPEKIELVKEFKEASDGYLVGGITDPYGNVFEAMFSLFKTITGDDWANMRNNQLLASKMGVISTPSWLITAFHISWFIFGAYLLLNILIGAVLNNFEELASKSKEGERQRRQDIIEVIEELEKAGYLIKKKE